MKMLHEQFKTPLQLESDSFSEETIKSLTELALVLKKIHLRMISEGYEIVDGVIRKVAIQQHYGKNKSNK